MKQTATAVGCCRSMPGHLPAQQGDHEADAGGGGGGGGEGVVIGTCRLQSRQRGRVSQAGGVAATGRLSRGLTGAQANPGRPGVVLHVHWRKQHRSSESG